MDAHQPFSVAELVPPSVLGPDAVTAVFWHADRLFVGTDKGTLVVFDLASASTSTSTAFATLISRNEGFARKSIDQLGVLPPSNALLCLSGGDVTLHSIPTLKIISTLAQHTRAVASLFCVLPNSIAIACRRKLLLASFSASGTPLPPTELPLPHQIRGLAASAGRLVAGFSTGEYGIVTLSPALTLGELFAPSTAGASSRTGLGTGLGGLAKATGLGAFVVAPKVDKNAVVAIPPPGQRDDAWLWSKWAGWSDAEPEGEVLLVRENMALPLSVSGKFRAGVTYPAPAEETLVLPPYILTLLPTPALSIHALPTLAPVQSLPLPGAARLLTASSTSPEAPLVLVTTTGTSQSLHLVRMRPWPAQIDSLIAAGQSDFGTLLLRAAGTISLPPSLLRRLSTLHAFTLFTRNSYESAVDGCIALDISPARVVALYPDRIAGKLSVEPEAREALFGGRTREQIVEANKRVEEERVEAAAAAAAESEAKEEDNKTTPSRLMNTAHWLKEPSKPREEPAGLALDKPDPKKEAAEFRRSVDALIRYLTDRRQKCAHALAALTTATRPTPASLSPASGSVLLELPDIPPRSLAPDQLARVAQVVDTALFRAYLATKPVMVGPLCRIENWCEVEEVEELLLTAKKFRELLDLYNGKNMHDRAVKLLRQMSDEEDDPEEKVGPTVRYLQKLGANHVELIFESSKWIFEVNKAAGLEIFIADLEEVESLPRHATMAHLESIETDLCTTYLEHIIHHLGEEGAEFHEKLIELYLAVVHEPAKHSNSEATYQKLLDFLDTSTAYRADRILGRLPSEDMHRVRAILLGRLGRHEGALQIYVYQLSDHATAEAYCRRVYDLDPDMRSSIFHILLRIYLRPRPSHPLLFAPALALISAHASSIGAIEVFELLPPLVAVNDIKVFLQKTLRRSGERVREGKVLKGVGRSWVEEEERAVVDLEERRVKITESRLCPQCHKRLGNSVIAIHSPEGAVTHYQCREEYLATKQAAGQ